MRDGGRRQQQSEFAVEVARAQPPPSARAASRHAVWQLGGKKGMADTPAGTWRGCQA